MTGNLLRLTRDWNGPGVCLPTLILLSLLWSGCESSCQKCQTVTVPTRQQECIETPPPRPDGDIEVAVCKGFAGCFTMENLVRLANYMDEVQTWAESSWARCGKLPEVSITRTINL
jgi:hypothetical protein